MSTTKKRKEDIDLLTIKFSHKTKEDVMYMYLDFGNREDELERGSSMSYFGGLLAKQENLNEKERESLEDFCRGFLWSRGYEVKKDYRKED